MGVKMEAFSEKEWQSEIIRNADHIASLQQHWLCRVFDEFDLTVWKVLCLKCRNAQAKGFRRVSVSDQPCVECGAIPKREAEDSGA